jgi:xanthine/CO dehydrogenase XdhC/CoxF family maturation factor
MGMALKQMERLLPTQSGRIERMTRTIVKVLENPRKPKAIQDYIREGGDPETVRRLGIASVEFNPNTPKATLFTTGAVKTLDIGRVVPAHENQQEAKAASRSGSVKEVSVDPRRIATSEDVRAVLGLAEDVEITQAMIKDRVATHNLMKEYDGVTLGDGAVFMFSPKGAKTPMFD